MADFDLRCNLCYENFDGDEHAAKILPCRQCHICCLQCVKSLTDCRWDTMFYQQCVYYGEACDPTLIHFECPFCHDVTHIYRRGIEFLTTFSILSQKPEHLSEARESLRRGVVLFKQSRKELDDLLKNTVTEVNQHHFNSNAARVYGSAAGVAGGILAGVGLFFIPFTFGASLGLSIAGGVLGASGAITSIGATAVEAIIGSAKKKEVEKKLKESNFRQIDVEDLLRQLKLEETLSELATISLLNKDSFGEFMNESLKIGLNMANIVRATLQLADVVTDVTGTAASFARLASVSKVFVIVGSVVGVVLLPVDIFFLTQNAMKIHNNTPSEFAVRLNESREKLKAETDTFIAEMMVVIDKQDKNMSYVS